MAPPPVGQLLGQEFPGGGKDVVRVGPEDDDVLRGHGAGGAPDGDEGVFVLDRLRAKVVKRPVDEVPDL